MPSEKALEAGAVFAQVLSEEAREILLARIQKGMEKAEEFSEEDAF